MSVRNGKPAICWFSRGAFVVAIAALPIGLTACTGSSLTAARLLASNGNAAGPHKPIIIDEAAAPEPHQQRGRKRRTTASAPRSTVGPAKTADAPRNTASSAKKVLAEARTLRLAGRRDDALRLLNTAASAHPDNIAISQQRALLTLEVGDIDRAERLLRKVVAKSPGDWRLHSALGAALAAKGNHKAAVVAFGKALKLSPGQPAILNNLAMSHAMAGNLAKAESFYKSNR